MSNTSYNQNLVAASLAALVAGCATPAVQQAAYRVELPVMVNGAEVQGARATVERGPTGTCSEQTSLFTDQADARVQYSVLEKTCDNNGDSVGDYRELTRIGRGETAPYKVEFVVSRADGRGKCLVMEYDTQDNQRVVTRSEVVDCTIQATTQ